MPIIITRPVAGAAKPETKPADTPAAAEGMLVLVGNTVVAILTSRNFFNIKTGAVNAFSIGFLCGQIF